MLTRTGFKAHFEVLWGKLNVDDAGLCRERASRCRIRVKKAGVPRPLLKNYRSADSVVALLRHFCKLFSLGVYINLFRAISIGHLFV
jgi:hypothetical protein